jgi:hypothetical protein
MSRTTVLILLMIVIFLIPIITGLKNYFRELEAPLIINMQRDLLTRSAVNQLLDIAYFVIDPKTMQYLLIGLFFLSDSIVAFKILNLFCTGIYVFMILKMIY